MKNPAAGGGRWVEVPPERLISWIAAFTLAHGGTAAVLADESGNTLTFTAKDGAVAECHPPFPGVPPLSQTGVAEASQALVAHAVADRTIGVLLVRLGGYAVGVFAGSPPRLVSSKTGSRPVHGRSAAGGWSQHRFARRRENQVAIALRAAADAAVTMFNRYGVNGLDAVVLGGDKRSVAGLRGDPRLEKYLVKATDRFLTVPDPRLVTLREIPRAFGSIRIRLAEPELAGPVAGGAAKLGDVLPTAD
jgi:Actinobacteria/chloroflexi VLRF1 release factor